MRLRSYLPGALLGLLVASASHGFGEPQSSLQITSPKAGSVVSGVVPITVEAPEEMGITFLVFGVDDSRPVSTNTRPFTCSWDTSAYLDGPHFLFAEAYGAGGIMSRVGPIRVNVRNRLPVAQLVQPPAMVAAGMPPLVGRAAPLVRVAASRLPIDAGVEPSVRLDGQSLDVPLRIVGDQALMPIRPFVERLDGSVAWNRDARVATAWWRTREVQLTVGSLVAMLNGSPIRLSRAPSIRDERIVLPARGCAQIFDLSVAWDALRRIVRLGSAPEPPRTEPATTASRSS